jgi:hypothetical protein
MKAKSSFLLAMAILVLTMCPRMEKCFSSISFREEADEVLKHS